MNTDEVSFLEWAFKGLVSILLGIGAWLWRGVMIALKEHERKIVELDKELGSHVLEDARIYVMKDDFKETVVEIKDMVKRIHDRLDHMNHDE